MALAAFWGSKNHPLCFKTVFKFALNSIIINSCDFQLWDPVGVKLRIAFLNKTKPQHIGENILQCSLQGMQYSNDDDDFDASRSIISNYHHKEIENIWEKYFILNTSLAMFFNKRISFVKLSHVRVILSGSGRSLIFRIVGFYVNSSS